MKPFRQFNEDVGGFMTLDAAMSKAKSDGYIVSDSNKSIGDLTLGKVSQEARKLAQWKYTKAGNHEEKGKIEFFNKEKSKWVSIDVWYIEHKNATPDEPKDDSYAKDYVPKLIAWTTKVYEAIVRQIKSGGSVVLPGGYGMTSLRSRHTLIDRLDHIRLVQNGKNIQVVTKYNGKTPEWVFITPDQVDVLAQQVHIKRFLSQYDE